MLRRWLAGGAGRGRWFLISSALHAGAVVALLLWLGERPDELEEQLIPLEVIPYSEEAPEEPPPETTRVLHFETRTAPRVREQLEIPREMLALAPPPPDVPLDVSAAGGGFGLDRPVRVPSALRGFTVGGAGGGSAGTGIGRGNSDGAGSFQEYVGGLRAAGLDVVFVIDATGSMGWLIDEVKLRVRDLARWTRKLVPVTRFGIVAYRDDDDPEFLTRVQPLTLSVPRVRRFLDRLEARGGGDIPEAVDAGLEAALEKMGWKSDTAKVIVVIGDAPPHPERMERTLALARRFVSAGGTVTTVDVSFDANPTLAAARLGKRVEELQTVGKGGPMPAYRELARAGGGDAATLEGERRVVRQLAVLIFGQRWSEEIRPLLGTL